LCRWPPLEAGEHAAGAGAAAEPIVVGDAGGLGGDLLAGALPLAGARRLGGATGIVAQLRVRGILYRLVEVEHRVLEGILDGRKRQRGGIIRCIGFLGHNSLQLSRRQVAKQAERGSHLKADPLPGSPSSGYNSMQLPDIAPKPSPPRAGIGLFIHSILAKPNPFLSKG